MTESPPDRWLVLHVPVPRDPEVRSVVVEELLALGARGVEERDDTLVVYLPPPGDTDPDTFADAVGRRLAEATGGAPIRIRSGWQPHEAWADRWRKHFVPREITPRIVVAPSWNRPEVGPHQCLVTVDPGMAFGTSDHATTRGCLRLLDRFVEPGDRVADLGAGSGILAIAAALLGAADVLAVELDPWACAAARENVSLNGVGERVRVRAGPVTTEGFPGESPFDGVVANIETGILLPLLPAMRGGLRDGGWGILSGILATEAPAVIRDAASARLAFVSEDVEGEWWTGAFRAEGSSKEHAPPEAGAQGLVGPCAPQ